MTEQKQLGDVSMGLTIVEAEWLASIARLRAEDTPVRGARADIIALAEKLENAVARAQEHE